MAREEPIAANAVIAVATKNNEHNMRRHRHGIHVRIGFVIIELAESVLIFAFIGVRFVEVLVF